MQPRGITDINEAKRMIDEHFQFRIDAILTRHKFMKRVCKELGRDWEEECDEIVRRWEEESNGG